eukprot:3941649-Rhodomonas_salina.2
MALRPVDLGSDRCSGFLLLRERRTVALFSSQIAGALPNSPPAGAHKLPPHFAHESWVGEQSRLIPTWRTSVQGLCWHKE